MTLPYANDYIICDCQSTDDTVYQCRQFFKKNQIKGQIFTEPWVDEAYNYSSLYQFAYMNTTSEYWWEFKVGDVICGQLDLNHLTLDKYLLTIGSNQFKYVRPQIFKNSIKWKHYLKVHGYISTNPKGILHTEDNVTGDYYIQTTPRYIDDRKTKYKEDAKMLEDDINNTPLDVHDTARCYFYLGQSYYCSTDYKKSIKAYKMRIECGGWDEEIYYSYFQIGLCYYFLLMDDMYNHFLKIKLLKPYLIEDVIYYITKIMSKDYFNKSLSYFLQSYKFRPQRLEGLYHAVKLYRQFKLYEKAYDYATLDKSRTVPDDKLFVNKECYLCGFDYELSIICFYLQKYDEGHESCQRLLEKDLPHDIKMSVLKNSRFYI
jgi:hypothetical protein